MMSRIARIATAPAHEFLRTNHSRCLNPWRRSNRTFARAVASEDADADAVRAAAASASRARPSVGDVIRAACDALTTSGEGIVRTPSGMVMLCLGATPGEVVDARVTKVKANACDGAKTRTVSRSSDGVDAPCAHYDECGGCAWQHVQYDAQVRYKRDAVVDVMERIARASDGETLVGRCEKSASTERYRNKMEFAFGTARESASTSRVIVGLRPRGSNDDVVELTSGCLLQTREADAVLATTREALKRSRGSLRAFDRTTGKGTLRSVTIRSGRDGSGKTSVMVDVATTASGDELLIGPLADLLRDISETPNVVSVVHTSVPAVPELRPGKNRSSNFVKGGRGIKAKSSGGAPETVVQAMYGENKLIDVVDGLQFELSSASFFQTNTAQATKLVQIMRDACGFSGNKTEVVLDLFCGVGTMGLSVASQAKLVMGWEVVPEAVRNAKRNAELNGIKNAKFYRVDLANLNPKLGARGLLTNPKTGAELPMPEIVVVDPARFGMSESLIAIIRAIGAKRIVYVSCNPATQARDALLLTAPTQNSSDARYALVSCQPVDMFPHTAHVESVVVFNRVDA